MKLEGDSRRRSGSICAKSWYVRADKQRRAWQTASNYASYIYAAIRLFLYYIIILVNILFNYTKRKSLLIYLTKIDIIKFYNKFYLLCFIKL